MKRRNQIFEKIIAWENLLFAFKKATLGKMQDPIVQKFFFYLEHEILQLQNEITNSQYEMKKFKTFVVHDTKKRKIAAPVFRDHLVAHAIYNVLYPIVDKMYISDSYASRLEKGPKKAVVRTQSFSKKYKYFLKLDVQNYFATVDHDILLNILCAKFKDKKLIFLLEKIIRHPINHYEKNKGLPLGHLTSQIFANLYLDGIDHYIKEKLKVKAYIRYMDDSLLFSNDKKQLHDYKEIISEYLQKKLALTLKESISIVAPVCTGIPYLGFLVYPRNIRLRNPSRRKIQRKIKEIEKNYFDVELQQRITGLLEHMSIANCYQLRSKWFCDHKE